MSLAFSNTTTKAGILQRLEKRLKLGDAYITGNATRLAQWTADVNLAADIVQAIILSVGGTWQYDDSNHTTTHPIITTDIVAGQRDYGFTTDGSSNIILEIFKVMVADEHGNFMELDPVDASQPGGAPSNYDDGLNTRGLPNTYDKLGNSIFLDPIPNYSYTAGLKVYISRESSYFATSDTTKKPGFAGLFHEYLVLHPYYNYAVDNSLKNASTIKKDLLEMENNIREYYKRREKDARKVLTARTNNPH